MSSRRRTRLVVVLLAVLIGATLWGSTGATASIGSDDFRAGEVYRGDFPDPGVMRVGKTYVAVSTNTGGKLLPAMTSTDLQTWRARYSNTGRWWENDALQAAAPWARRHYANGKWRVSTWAPDVEKIGARYVAAYTAPVSLSPRKMCISLAVSTKPLGPFVDRSSRPFVCAPDQGSIDPSFYRDARGRYFLLWKNEGIRGREPTRLWIRRLDATGTAFAPGSRAFNLLTTAAAWEGDVIENPSMVTVGGRTYLFYSANEYVSASYATGYAVCRTWFGGCRRPTTTPLLASGGAVSGPGGPHAFVDHLGGFRLAYAAWDFGRVGYPATDACKGTTRGCNQRRLHVATLRVLPDGRLAVARRG